MRYFRDAVLRRALGVILLLGFGFGLAESGIAEVHDGDGARGGRAVAQGPDTAPHVMATADTCAAAPDSIGAPGHDGDSHGSVPSDHPTRHVCHDSHAHGWVVLAVGLTLDVVPHREALDRSPEPIPPAAPHFRFVRPPIA